METIVRNAFIETLITLAEKNPRLMLITADLGFRIFDDFIERFPEQFLNVGVAEQNMIGVGTGLAQEGWTVFAYSIGNFSTLRCLEQIRNDAAYHNVNLTVVASGGGMAYGTLGMSHHATEDLAILRALPGITVTAPCDVLETVQLTQALADRPGVGYLRLERSSSLKSDQPVHLGQPRRLREGNDLTLMATGGIVSEVMAAAEMMVNHGIEARVLSIHTVKPLNPSEIHAAIIETGGIVTVEEHTVMGGLGSTVMECFVEQGMTPGFFMRLGLPDRAVDQVGDQAWLRTHYGLDAVAIVQRTRQLFATKKTQHCGIQ
ncbi:MAG: transketolase [Magnetococcales bacterium]|nr:transketolase [Magnetococcales bacterium]